MRRSWALGWLIIGLLILKMGCGDGTKPPLGPEDGENTPLEEIPSEISAFVGTGLLAAVSQALDKSVDALSIEDLLSLTGLDASNRSIVDLRGIEQLKNLTTLVLGANNVGDISMLTSLEKLMFLDLSNNQIVDISPLSSLKHLQALIVDNNEIHDISPLLELTDLVSVELRGNPLDDTSLDSHLSILRGRDVHIGFEIDEAPLESMEDDASDDPSSTGSMEDAPPGSGVPQIAFSSNRRTPGAGTASELEIYVIEIDGGNPVNLSAHLTSLPLLDGREPDSLVVHVRDGRQPSWSPDGAWIAFSSQRDGNDEIYIMALDGRHPVNLTKHSARDGAPSWSPDGRRIAFVSDRNGNSNIFAMDANGDNVKQLTFDGSVDAGNLSWSPDGRQIAFASWQGGIYVLNLDSRDVAQLTDDPHSNSPSWSPNGFRIAFAKSDTSYSNSDIYTMNADGSGVIQLTDNLIWEFEPCWSPDGKRIAFTVSENATSDIFVMDADGDNVTQMTDDSADDRSPAWAPF